MNDFDYEVMQRKRLAGQAKYRKRGSKSKKCPMSTDHMTQREWEKRCGEIETYQLGAPMAWKDFRQLPIHIQKTYLENIVEKYSATATDLARMFGVTVGTVLKVCNDESISIKFHRGKRMNAEQKVAFESFVYGTTVESKDEEDTSHGGNGDNIVDINDGRVSKHMVMSGFGLDFCGEFDRNMIYNSIASMLPIGANVRIKIQCEILG